MPIIKKPDYTIFASEAKNGELTDFPNLLRGWGVTIDQTAGKPPMEWFNVLQKRTDEWLTYLSQRGLPEWQSTLDYPKDAVVQFDSQYYVAKKATRNAQPDRSQKDWVLFSDVLGVSGALAKSANLSDVDDKEKARENLGLGKLAIEDSVSVATTTIAGITKLSSATDSNDETMAATPKAVKVAYDLAKSMSIDITQVGRDIVGKNAIADVLTYLGLRATGQNTDNLLFTGPDGLKIQVFRRTLANQSTVGVINSVPVTFPVPFPVNCWGVFATKLSWVQVATSCESVSNTGFTAQVMMNIAVNTNTSDAMFLAIGY